MKLTRIACAGLVMAASAVWLGDMALVGRADTAVTNPRKALVQTVHDLKVDGSSIEKVINYLRDVSGSNIVVNWKVLEGAGVAKDTPITLEVHELPLQKMLQLVLDQASPNTQLVYNVDSNVIQVTTQEDADKQMITKVYIVDDLVMVADNTVQAPKINLQSLTQNIQTQQFGNGSGGGGGSGGFGGGSGSSGGGSGGSIFQQNNTSANQTKQTTEDKGKELVDLIESVIRPNIWKDNGGTASIRYFSGKLIVTAPASVHEAIGGPVEQGGIRFGG